MGLSSTAMRSAAAYRVRFATSLSARAASVASYKPSLMPASRASIGFRLSVQAGELTVPVQLDTMRSSDLAAGGDGNRTRCHHNEIRDAQTMRVEYR